MSFEIDPGFGHWLAGFVDGEGCFTIVSQSRKGHANPSLICCFKLALHADDAPILWEISERLGVGRVHVGHPPSQKGPRATLTVSKKAECQRLVELFTSFPLRAKKARDFKIWAVAVSEWSTKLNGVAGQDWSHIAALRVRLSEGRPSRGRLSDLRMAARGI